MRLGAPKQLPRIDCACQGSTEGATDEIHEGVVELRGRCSALSQLLLPDDSVEMFLDLEANLDIAEHDSKLAIAFGRNSLHRLTSPVHRYLMSKGELKPGLSNASKMELAEPHWLSAKTPKRKHQRSRGHSGFLAELLVAEWLEMRGCRVKDLAALGAKYDIIGFDADDRLIHLELKRIGREDIQFASEIASLCGIGSSAYTSDPYASANYVISRVGKAGLQLAESSAHKVVFLVIEDGALDRLEIPLSWISWASPEYLEAGAGWKKFLAKIPEGIRVSPCDAIAGIDHIFILQENGEFELQLHSQYER